ncbi:MAG: DUF1294 domain-containing protein [Lachnospiraceae bacterium]|nr:DUF1294 domain-containing protein [Lachnospiraceae bacterium]
MKDIWLILLIYLAAVNLFGLIIMGVDKSRAKRRKWRIPEATLFLVAIIGGSVGSIAGMYLFRHKTKHWYFVAGMPVILVLQIIAALIMYFAPLNLFFM